MSMLPPFLRRFPIAILLLILAAATQMQAQLLAPKVGFVEDVSGADRIHGLTELSKRTRIKPFASLSTPNGEFGCERLVFQDSVTRATVWKMTRNPGFNRHVYSNIAVWNIDGSELCL